MIPTFFFPPKKYMKTKTHVAGHVASSGFLWLPPASSGEKASCRYLWNLWYRTDVGETCGTWFIRWISSGFFGGFLVELVKKLFIFQGQFGELPPLVLVVMWFSRGLFSQQLPTHSDFWNYRDFACFSCGNGCPFTIMVHHLSRLTTALLFILPSYSCAYDSSISLSFIAGIRKPRN